MKHTLTHLAFLILTTVSFNAYSCSCGRGSPPNSDEVKKYEHIFIARILKSEIVPKSESNYKLTQHRFLTPFKESIKTEFEVIETLKGNPNKVKFIYGLPFGNSCSSELHVGGKYLIYTTGINAQVTVCSKSHGVYHQKPIEYIEKDRAELKNLRKLLKDKSSNN